MLLWDKPLDKIESMRVVKVNDNIYVLINGEYLEKELHKDEPYKFYSIQTAQEFINDIVLAQNAIKIGRAKNDYRKSK